MAKPSMKGQINTPDTIARFMVTKLFLNNIPTKDHTLLDPGCGQGTFIKAVLEWCKNNDHECPRIVGIESDGRLLRKLQQLEFTKQKRSLIKLIEGDFLLDDIVTSPSFDFIIANPPYVRLEQLLIKDRKTYRKKFETAVHRFDLYLLFFERALKTLKPGGSLVFLTPERFEYSVTARPLRKIMVNFHVEEIHHMSEDMFKDIVTSPAITVIANTRNINDLHPCSTKITYRNGLTQDNILLPSDGSSWLSVMCANDQKITISDQKSGYTLSDVCLRISCGIATGLDEVFIIDKNAVPEHLKPYACPTVGGRDLTSEGIVTSKKMLIPYNQGGLLPQLLSTKKLLPLISWLSKERERLKKRTCVTKRGKRWYSFHEDPPLKDILQPKILCKDIAKEPQFWIDRHGEIVPRHSVYYIIPKSSEILNELARYLNSSFAKDWLRQNCPRAVHGHIRMQSTFLKKLPIPVELTVSPALVIPSPMSAQNNLAHITSNRSHFKNRERNY